MWGSICKHVLVLVDTCTESLLAPHEVQGPGVWQVLGVGVGDGDDDHSELLLDTPLQGGTHHHLLCRKQPAI